MKCNNCGADLADNAKFCTSCGANVESQRLQVRPKYCPYCGRQLPADACFCTYCGQRLEDPVWQGAPANNYIRPRKNKTGLKKLGLAVGGTLLAILLIVFVILPLFNTGLSEKKAAKLVENTVESLMDFNLDKASKNFTNVNSDDYKDFVDQYTSMQSEFNSQLGYNSLGKFIDVKIIPMDFNCDKSDDTAQGTFSLVYSPNKKGIQNSTINKLLNGSNASDAEDVLKVEFVKVGRKWKIKPVPELLFSTSLSENQAAKIVEDTFNGILSFDFDKVGQNFTSLGSFGYKEFIDGYDGVQRELKSIIGDKTLADFMSIKVTPKTLKNNKYGGKAQGTFSISFKLNEKGLSNTTIRDRFYMINGLENILNIEFVKVGRKWKIWKIN